MYSDLSYKINEVSFRSVRASLDICSTGVPQGSGFGPVLYNIVTVFLLRLYEVVIGSF